MLRQLRLRKRTRFFTPGDLWFIAALGLLAILGIGPALVLRFLPAAQVVLASTVPQLTTGASTNYYNAPPWIDISVQERLLRLRSGDEQVIWQAPIAVGKSATPTPKGEFAVIEKVENPIWQNPFNPREIYSEKDPRNPLGKRWIGFKQQGLNDYGVHGTTSLDSIGRAVTNGCVRLRNEDILFLYDQIEEGTLVVIH